MKHNLQNNQGSFYVMALLSSFCCMQKLRAKTPNMELILERYLMAHYTRILWTSRVWKGKVICAPVSHEKLFWFLQQRFPDVYMVF